MSKEIWRPSNMLYPVPAVIVSCADHSKAEVDAAKEAGTPLEVHDNLMTAAWAGTICSDPVMVSVSIRAARHSHDMIEQSGEFVLNLTTEAMAFATDYVGVRSGAREDKWETSGLHREPSVNVAAPGVKESPVSLECKVEQVLRLGSHDMYIAKVLSTDIDPQYLDEKGKFDLDLAKLIAYNHGEYWSLGEKLGTFGYSVRKDTKDLSKKGKTIGKATKPAAGKDHKNAGKYVEEQNKSAGKSRDINELTKSVNEDKTSKSAAKTAMKPAKTESDKRGQKAKGAPKKSNTKTGKTLGRGPKVQKGSHRK